MMTFPASMIDDIFTQNIVKVIQFDYVKSVVDIGAHNGDSSTLVLFNAMKDKTIKKLYALEPYLEAFHELVKRYRDYEWVVPVNKITIKLSENNTLAEVQDFYNKFHGSLNRLPFSEVANIYVENLNYLRDNKIQEDGLDFIIRNNEGLPDAILLDGSSFSNTYKIEFPKYYGTKVIILDDTRCMKNMKIREHLISDSSYDCFYDDLNFRFGVSIFVKKKTIVVD